MVTRPVNPVRTTLLLLALVVLLSTVVGVLSVLAQRAGVPGWLVTSTGAVGIMGVVSMLGARLAGPGSAEPSEPPVGDHQTGRGPE